MTLRKLFGCCLASLVAALICAEIALADTVVVVSAKNTDMRLTSEQVGKIFLGKVDTFPNGGSAEPVDQAEGSPVRDDFYVKVAHKSPAQLNAYWARIIFTGSGHPPKLREDSIAVRREVAGNVRAIGYIDRSAVDASVRIVLIPQ